jgi:hypothetical protein
MALGRAAVRLAARIDPGPAGPRNTGEDGRHTPRPMETKP